MADIPARSNRSELLAIWEELPSEERQSLVDFAAFLRVRHSGAEKGLAKKDIEKSNQPEITPLLSPLERKPAKPDRRAVQRVRDALSDMSGTLSKALHNERNERV